MFSKQQVQLNTKQRVEADSTSSIPAASNKRQASDGKQTSTERPSTTEKQAESEQAKFRKLLAQRLDDEFQSLFNEVHRTLKIERSTQTK